MENASKALMIAGAVMLAILVMTVGVYFSKSIAEHSAETYKKLEEHKKNEYNQKFFNYDNKDITIEDIATLIYLAKSCNDSGDTERVTVNLKKCKDVFDEIDFNKNISELEKAETFTQEDVNDLVKKWVEKKVNKDNLSGFKCKTIINMKTGYVNKIEIEV